MTRVRKTLTYEHKDPREIYFRIPKIKERVEVVLQVRNPTYLDLDHRSTEK